MELAVIAASPGGEGGRVMTKARERLRSGQSSQASSANMLILPSTQPAKNWAATEEPSKTERETPKSKHTGKRTGKNEQTDS